MGVWLPCLLLNCCRALGRASFQLVVAGGSCPFFFKLTTCRTSQVQKSIFMKNNYFLLLALLVFAISSNAQQLTPLPCGGVHPPTSNGPESNINHTTFGNCGAPNINSVYQQVYRYQENFKPNSNSATKTIHVNLIIWQDDSGTVNWLNTPDHRDRLTELIDY